jgi:inorganic triphosphatase YgiF
MDPSVTSPQEIELKLSIDPAALPQLKRHAALAAVKAGRSRTARVSSTYYDTPALELRAARVALRLRHVGRRWLQTVKGEGSAAAGLHQRAEYEWPIPGPHLDHARLAETPWSKLFTQNAIAPRLKPVFRTEISRTTQPLAFADGTRGTLCVDVGTVRGGRRRSAISEIEIELVTGSAQRLFELARALATDLPLTVAHVSKAERGYALIDQTSPKPVRAQTVSLAADVSATQALAAIAGDCLTQIGGNAGGVAAGTDPEFLHQMRIGVRRLRSLFRLAEEMVPAELLAPLDRELRWFAATLGPARDWDVFLGETLPPIARQFRGRRELAAVRARASRSRKLHLAVAQSAVTSPRFHGLMLALGGFFAGLSEDVGTSPRPPTASAFARALLERRARKLHKAAKGLPAATPAERHAVRIAAKKLRYASEFFAPLFPGKRTHGYIRLLSRLQTALGVLNDLATAERLLTELAPLEPTPAPRTAHAVGLVRGWIAASALPELAVIDKAWRAFSKRKPFWN